MTTNTNSAQERTASIDLAQLDKLEALARGATPGPWTATHWTCHAATTVMRSGTTSAIAETTGFGRDATECAVEAAYIAAANPATMLQLIALARRSLTSGAPAEPVLGAEQELRDTLVELASTQRKLIDANAEIAALLLSAGAAAKTEQAPVGYIAEDARGMLAAGRPITLNVSADNVGPWCVPIYLAASSATAAGAGSAQQADTKGAALDEPTNAEMLSALQCAERLLRAAGFTMTGTASSKIVAAIAAASRDAGQEEASTQTVPDGAAGTVEKDAALLASKRFLEDMHMMPIDWTINESQILHAQVSAAIEAHNKAGKEQGC